MGGALRRHSQDLFPEPKRLSGSHRLASRWSGSARGMRRVGSGTGTGALVPVVALFLLCLLSEASWGEGLGISSPLPGCHFWHHVPETYSLGFFWFRVVRRWTSDPEVDFWTIWRFLRAPRIRQSLVRCLGRGGVQETLDLLGGDFRNFPFSRYASFDSVDALASVYGALRLLVLAATCSVLYVALERAMMRIFWEMTSRVISAFSAYWLDSGYMYGVSSPVLGISHFLRAGVLGLSLCTFTPFAD